MKDFKDKVAVITGGAGGIGYALAQYALNEGMKVVIADIREEALEEAKKSLDPSGEKVLAVVTDVSKLEDIKTLAQKTLDHFGKINLLFNNAGFFASGIIWETSIEEYRWAIDVNLMSVIYGITTFVPIMIKQGDECHVINTASGAGIITMPGYCTYSTTKHGIVALSDVLYLDLATQKIPNIGVTVVMPGVIQSKVMSPEKTTPDNLMDEVSSRLENPILAAVENVMSLGVEYGMPAIEAAEMIFNAIRNGDLYVLPNFEGEDTQAMATSIALGRVKGQNPYEEIAAMYIAMAEQD